MILREFVAIAAANLWRLKLRTALTAAGVLIGIAALVAMLSFAFGIQRNVANRFRALGLFHTLHVMPPVMGQTGMEPDAVDPDMPSPEKSEGADVDQATGAGSDASESPESPESSEPPDGDSHDRDADAPARLNDETVAKIAALDGVTTVYPQDTFDARLEWKGQSRALVAQSLPAEYVAGRELGRLIAGRFFDSDTARVILLDRRVVRRLDADPDSLIGQTVRLRIASRAAFIRQFARQFFERLNLPRELEEWVERLAGTLFGAAPANELDLTVCGVAEFEAFWGFRLQGVLVPSGVVAGLDRMSFSDPFEMVSQLAATDADEYSLVAVTLAEDADHVAVRDEIEDLGLRTFSFADQFEQVKRQFLIFDLMMAVLGFIALLVASLGIVNTMVISIIERTREIGILKSLGAEDGQVRVLFLVESALIGLIGSVGGLIFGWLVSRTASLVVQRIMAGQGAPQVDLFHLPPLIALGAVVFGVLISLLAGLHPATRAARVDPVRALRRE